MTVPRVTSARSSSVVGSMLLALCCLAPGAAAFDPPQSAPAGPAASAEILLPTFLDADRLPDLQAAWRTLMSSPAGENDGRSAAPAFVPPLYVEPPAAHSGAQPAKQSGHATVVRQRAEELSRRFFGADSAASEPVQQTAAPAAQPPAQPPVAAVTAKEPLPPPYAIGADPFADRGEVADAVAGTPPPAHAGAPVTAPGEADTTTAALPDPAQRAPEPLPRKSLAAGGAHVGVPPLPRRRPDPATLKAEIRHDALQTRRVRTTVSPAPSPPPVNDAKKEVFPHYMRAFGWDAQP